LRFAFGRSPHPPIAEESSKTPKVSIQKCYIRAHVKSSSKSCSVCMVALLCAARHAMLPLPSINRVSNTTPLPKARSLADSLLASVDCLAAASFSPRTRRARGRPPDAAHERPAAQSVGARQRAIAEPPPPGAKCGCAQMACRRHMAWVQPRGSNSSSWICDDIMICCIRTT
jgi:hypothetical protein